MIEPYYKDELVTLYHGDCLEVLPQLSEKSVDMVLADLPYGITELGWDSIIDLSKLWFAYERVSVGWAAIVLFGRQPFTSQLVMSKSSWYRDEWIWEKDRAVGHLDAERRPMRAHENVLIFGKQRPRFFPQKTEGHPPTNRQGGSVGNLPSMLRDGLVPSTKYGQTDRFPRTVQRFDVPNGDLRGLHPTLKPIDLCKFFIKTYSLDNETILDNTCGAGTTLVAAKQLGRKAIGIEIEEKYCETAARRLQQEMSIAANSA